MGKVTVLEMSQFVNKSSSNDFYITTISNHLKVSHREISVPHKHNFFVTILFTHGSGIHEIDFIAYEVKPGSLFFLNPGQMHYWQLSAKTDGYIILHTEQFYNIQFTNNRVNEFPFFAGTQNPPYLYIDSISTAALASLFIMALQETDGNQLYFNHKLCSILDLIYIECARKYNEVYNTQILHWPNSSKFDQLEQLIEVHFYAKKLPSQYADMLNITTKHLNRITQQAVAKTTSEVITDRVILEAKRELVLRKNGFAHIAQNLGYEDYAYFSRLFKLKTGETPSQFLARYYEM